MHPYTYEFDFEGTISCEDGNKSLKLTFRALRGRSKMEKYVDRKIPAYLEMAIAARGNLSHGTLLR